MGKLDLRCSWEARYGTAVVAVGLTLLLQLLLASWFGVNSNLSTFMTFLVAVMIASWFGGLGMGLLATALSAVLSWYFFLSPHYSFAINALEHGLQLILFVLEGLVISALVEAMHRARRQAERAQKAKSQAEDKYRSIFENAVHGIFQTSLDGRILTANPATARILGYKSPEELMSSVSDIGRQLYIDPDDWTRFLRLIQQQGMASDSEDRMYRKDGSMVWVSISARALRDESGDLVGYESMMVDVTERKEAKSALSEVREAERRHIARDLHDGVLQELTDVLYSMEVWRLRLGEESEYLPEIRLQIDHLRGAIQALRDTLKSVRQDSSQEQPFVQLLTSVVAANRQKAPEMEMRLSLAPSFSLELSEGTGINLLRIVQEALVNVRRHSGAQLVQINLWAEGEYLNVEVVDDGRGFDQEIDPEATWGRVGIAAMRERALNLGGDLDIQSEPGEGTRIRARIPAPEGFAAVDLAFRGSVK